MKKRLSLILSLGEALLFPVVGLALYDALMAFVVEAASTAPEFPRILPLLLMGVTLAVLWFVLHAIRRPRSEATRKATYLGGGAVLLLLGASTVILDMVYAFSGTFASLLESKATWLYPIDTLVVGFLSDFLGAFLIFLYVKKGKEMAELSPHPWPLWKRIVLGYLLFPLYAMVAMFFAGTFLFSLVYFDRDFSHFGVTLSFYLLMILPSVSMLLYEHLVRDSEGVRRFNLILRGGSAFLLTGIVLSLWGYFGSLQDPYAISDSLVNAFPLDFLISKAIGPILLYLLALVPPLSMLLSFLFAKKKEDPRA